MLNRVLSTFRFGLINEIEAQSIPDGAASDALNWLTKGDLIELRRGSEVLGTEQSGSGRITGLHVTYKADGTAIYVRSRGKKVEYYDSATEDWVEIGSDLLGSDADGEDVFFANYNTNAGAQLWFSSPNSAGLFKVMTANMDDVTNVSGSENYKGWIAIHQNRMWLWGRNEDKTGIYGSHIDAQSYTTVDDEALDSGDGSTKTFNGTLAFKAGDADRTCFAVSITDGTETFTDDYNGVLTGSAGGTGTINYTTGEWSVTFNTAPVVGVDNITADYQWENTNADGISDFTFSGTRLAGEGFVFRQDDGGGDVKTVMPLKNTMYCFHERRTWVLTLTNDDTNADNDIFREFVGIPYIRAALASSVGIFYLDVTDENKPLFRRLRYDSGSSEVIPETISANVDLSGFLFDKCAMWEWNDYIMFSGRTKSSTVNNRLFLFNKNQKTEGAIDILDHYVSTIVTGNGTLLAGESISDNVVTLFSGFDDSDSLINNYWIGNISDLGAQTQLKKVKRLVVEGNIQTNQTLNVYISSDRGGFSLIGTIAGTDTQVDFGQAVTVGSYTVGSKEVGGGGDGVNAYHFQKEFAIQLDKFEHRQIRLVATGIGYVSVTKITDHDVRLHEMKIPRKYRVTTS